MSGTGDELKGRVKETIGEKLDDDELRREGHMDRAGGAVKDKARDLKEWVEEKVDEVKERMEEKRER